MRGFFRISHYVRKMALEDTQGSQKSQLVIVGDSKIMIFLSIFENELPASNPVSMKVTSSHDECQVFSRNSAIWEYISLGGMKFPSHKLLIPLSQAYGLNRRHLGELLRSFFYVSICILLGLPRPCTRLFKRFFEMLP